MSKYTRENASPGLKLFRNIIIWLVMIPFLGYYLLLYLEDIFYSYSSLFVKNMKDIIIVILILIFVPKIFRYIKALFKRKFLLKRIRRVCSEKGYRYERMSNLYLSVFVDTPKPEFLVITDKTIYSVNLFSALKKRNALDFCSETSVQVAHMTLKALPPIYTTRKYSLGEPTLPKDLTKDLPVEKILLVNPAPYKITKSTERGTSLVDNNEKMFGYTLYAGTGFCNMLDRL